MPERQDPYTFGELKALLAEVIDRGGDSELNDSLRGHYINAAEQFICSELGGHAYFLHVSRTLTVFIGASSLVETGGIVTLPVDVADVFSLRDEANRRPLEYIDREQFYSYITNASATSGTPLAWTKYGFVRRTNTESPAQPYGQMQLQVWPVPTADKDLLYEAVLRPGHMVADGDMPVLPISFHWGLLEIASWYAGAYDVGSKAYNQHRELGLTWLASVKRDANRQLSGSTRLVPIEEHVRRAGSWHSFTRAAQLGRR